MKEELYISSLTTAPENKISFFSLLWKRSLKGNIEEIYAVLKDDIRKPELVVDIGKRALGVEIKPGQVHVTDYTPNECDTSFAKELGFTILPVAYVAFKKGEDLQAWIGPALVPAEHPLYHKTEKDNSVHVTSKKAEDRSGKGFSYYVRLEVKDRAGALAQVCQEFANKEISIRQMCQPETGNENGKANMAFLLWPCQAKVLYSSLAAIAELSDVISVNTPLRAFSKSK